MENILDNDPIKKAREIFLGNYNCAQAVFRTILEEKELYFDQAPNVAAGFGGGISRRGELCGALTGAIMAIGVIQGQKFVDPGEHKNQTYKSVGEFIEKFNVIHGTPICNELVGYDIRDPEARKIASDKGVFSTICPKFVEDAVKIILEMFPE